METIHTIMTIKYFIIKNVPTLPVGELINLSIYLSEQLLGYSWLSKINIIVIFSYFQCL